MKIAMGNDHSAVEMKEAMKAYVESKGYEVIDFEPIQPKAVTIRSLGKRWAVP